MCTVGKRQIIVVQYVIMHYVLLFVGLDDWI